MGRDLYPVFLDLSGRTVVVVGGGAVAADRTARLAACGARVRLVSPEVLPALGEMVSDGRIAEHHARGYADGDLDGAGAVSDELSIVTVGANRFFRFAVVRHTLELLVKIADFHTLPEADLTFVTRQLTQ